MKFIFAIPLTCHLANSTFLLVPKKQQQQQHNFKTYFITSYFFKSITIIKLIMFRVIPRLIQQKNQPKIELKILSTFYVCEFRSQIGIFFKVNRKIKTCVIKMKEVT